MVQNKVYFEIQNFNIVTTNPSYFNVRFHNGNQGNLKNNQHMVPISVTFTIWINSPLKSRLQYFFISYSFYVIKMMVKKPQSATDKNIFCRF